jgi:DNA-binding Lrp family transcriptional regulator
MKIEEGAASYLIAKANSLKVKAGLAFDEAVSDLLDQLKEAGVIKGFELSASFAHGAYEYAKQ